MKNGATGFATPSLKFCESGDFDRSHALHRCH
jgi:hypothetical protein